MSPLTCERSGEMPPTSHSFLAPDSFDKWGTQILKRMRTGSIKLIITTFIAVTLANVILLAQPFAVEARIASATAKTKLIRNARAFALRKGDRLLPGDEIDTTAGGRVVISLSDGSLVTVAPGSIAVLKDFRQASNLRELIDVALGSIRVKIRKLGGRPNPYRVNSPTASIAVRGTEFIVRVESNGETTVTVTEGLVEVSSRINQEQKTLVEPGRSVIVRPSGDIGLNLVGPGSELEARSKPLSDQSRFLYRDSEYAMTFAYNIYNRSITEKTFNNAPSRFAAFSDAHFDSLTNPAYATEFKRGEGRFYLLPSWSEPLTRVTGSGASSLTQPPAAHRFDLTLTGQSSYFTPLGSRWVVGGGLARARTDLESAAVRETRYERDGYTHTYSFNGAFAADAVTASLVAARRFGAGERTSIGVKLERLTGHAELRTREESVERLDDFPEPFTGLRFNNATARSHRISATLGLAHDFARGDKLGLSYSYSAAGGGFQYQSDEVQALYDNAVTAKQIAANASEIALLLRGPLTRKMFYGLEASLVAERTTDDYQFKRSLLIQRRQSQQPRVGGGIGVVLRPGTVLSFDLSRTQKQVREQSVEIFTDRLNTQIFRDDPRYRATFFNRHWGLQTELGRRFVASASVLRVDEWRYFELFDYGEKRRATFSHIGFGWRLRTSLLAQYYLSTDYGSRGPSHTFVLRYDFGLGGVGR